MTPDPQRDPDAAEVLACLDEMHCGGCGGLGGGGDAGASGAVDVFAELSRLVGAVTSFRDFTEARLRALSADEWAAHGPRVAAQVRMFETACDQARRLLRDVARLGLDERALEADARISV